MIRQYPNLTLKRELDYWSLLIMWLDFFGFFICVSDMFFTLLRIWSHLPLVWVKNILALLFSGLRISPFDASHILYGGFHLLLAGPQIQKYISSRVHCMIFCTRFPLSCRILQYVFTAFSAHSYHPAASLFGNILAAGIINLLPGMQPSYMRGQRLSQTVFLFACHRRLKQVLLTHLPSCSDFWELALSLLFKIGALFSRV